MTTRRLWLAAPLMLFGCTNPNDRLEILPMNLGEWKRLAVENIPAEEHPEALKRLGIKRSRRGIYQGPLKLTVSVYEFGAPAVAFELVQKWTPQRNKMVFHQGPYYMLLEAEPADNALMNRFAATLEGALKQ